MKSCYWFSSEAKTFDESVNDCKRRGQTLITVDDEDEWEKIFEENKEKLKCSWVVHLYLQD